MDPMTAALLVSAAMSMAGGAYKGKRVAQADRAQIGMEVEQAKLQAEQQALAVAKQYREVISFGSALNAAGFGSSTGFRALASASEGAAGQDIKQLEKSQRFAEITGRASKSAIGLNKLVGLADTGVKTLSLAKDFGMFAKKQPTQIKGAK